MKHLSVLGSLAIASVRIETHGFFQWVFSGCSVAAALDPHWSLQDPTCNFNRWPPKQPGNSRQPGELDARQVRVRRAYYKQSLV